MIQFDWYVSIGLKPPTSYVVLTKNNDNLCGPGNVGFVGGNFHRNPMVWSVAWRLRRKKLGDAPPWSGPPKTKTPPQTTAKNANPLGRSCSVFSFSWVYSNLLLLLYQHWSTNESDADTWGSGTGWEGHFHRSDTQLGIQVPWCHGVGLLVVASRSCAWINLSSIVGYQTAGALRPSIFIPKIDEGQWCESILNICPVKQIGAFSCIRFSRNRYCNISVLYVKCVNWLWCIAIIYVHTHHWSDHVIVPMNLQGSVAIPTGSRHFPHGR